VEIRSNDKWAGRKEQKKKKIKTTITSHIDINTINNYTSTSNLYKKKKKTTRR